MSILPTGDAARVLAAMDRSLAIISFDTKGHVLRANANFCSAMGYQPNEIVGKHHRIFVDAAHATSAEYLDFWRRLAAGEVVASEFRRQGKGGRDVWLQASYNAVRNARGKVYKVVKFATDITAQKRVAAENMGKMTAISRAQAVIEFSPDGTILTANENFLSTFGYHLSEVVGQHHSTMCDPATVASPQYGDFWRKLANGEFFSGEFTRRAKSGKDVFLQASYNPIFDMDGNVVKIVKFATDVSERVRDVNRLGEGLKRLADGDLQQRIDQAFIPSLDGLRVDFNQSVEKLEHAMRSVAASARAIDLGAEQVRHAGDDLARRTEHQAAALEETSAALADTTQAVQVSSTQADQAGSLVGKARTGAEHSRAVVSKAIDAMNRIATSSNQIGTTISVIDEIAFQTNLLALNAGVEAARAGDSGRGFAVVAQEVRSLAQRSAVAAKEIAELIARSREQVEQGVTLVGETGSALELIVSQVCDIDINVKTVAESAQHQAVGLREINVALGTLNDGTQQNAAMVEESTAASNELADEARQLSALLQNFKVGSDGHRVSAKQAAGASAVRGMQSRVALAFG